MLSKKQAAYLGVIVFAAVIGGVCVAVITTGTGPGQQIDPSGIEERVESREPSDDIAGFGARVAGIVDRVGPAVVKVVTQQQVLIDNFFFQSMETREGVGSGVLFDDEGHILTNNHVISNAGNIRVFLPDGRSFQGRLTGSDPLSDLAVLQIQGDDLPVAELGDSDKLDVGQFVVAIGNPFRFDNSVTVGVISALGRNISVDPRINLDLQDMIQTDASINPGNSGGPLLDEMGRVIGINTAIFQPAQGIGFAIPVNTAKGVAAEILRYGKVIRLGIIGGTLTPEIARALEEETGEKLPVSRGAFAVRVLADTPAAAAGIENADIIVEANGVQVTKMSDLIQQVKKSGFGGAVNITLYRDGRRRRVTAVLR